MLLVTPDGCLLEGLTSNFFVLSGEGAVVTAEEGVLSGTVRELVLEVGSMCMRVVCLCGGSSVLHFACCRTHEIRDDAGRGSVYCPKCVWPQLAIWLMCCLSACAADFFVACGQVCREQGVPVQLQPPRLLDIDSWQGAFISSTSRLLLPACEVQYSDAAGQPRKRVGDGWQGV